MIKGDLINLIIKFVRESVVKQRVVNFCTIYIFNMQLVAYGWKIGYDFFN